MGIIEITDYTPAGRQGFGDCAEGSRMAGDTGSWLHVVGRMDGTDEKITYGADLGIAPIVQGVISTTLSRHSFLGAK
jgi:hypothetical protein